MSLTPLDHALALLLLLITLDGKSQIQHLVTLIKHGIPHARVRTYYDIIYMQWLISIWLILTWITLDRPAPPLGISLGNSLSWFVGAPVLVLVAFFLYMQRRTIKALPQDKLNELQQSLGEALAIMPRSPREHRWFSAVSITAGCCEELLYRGFLIWYLNHWCLPAFSLIISCTAFGLAHYYQGLAGVFRTAIVGLLMGIVYLVTDTLLWPILAHAMIDLGACWTSSALLQGLDETASTGEDSKSSAREGGIDETKSL